MVYFRQYTYLSLKNSHSAMRPPCPNKEVCVLVFGRQSHLIQRWLHTVNEVGETSQGLKTPNIPTKTLHDSKQLAQLASSSSCILQTNSMYIATYRIELCTAYPQDAVWKLPHFSSTCVVGFFSPLPFTLSASGNVLLPATSSTFSFATRR